MPEHNSKSTVFALIVALPACSLLVDTNPDGVIDGSSKAGATSTAGVSGGAGAHAERGGSAGATALVGGGSGLAGTPAVGGNATTAGGSTTSAGGVTAAGGVAATAGRGQSGGNYIGGGDSKGGATNSAGGPSSGGTGVSTGGASPIGGSTSTGGTTANGGTSSVAGNANVGGAATGDVTPPRVMVISPSSNASGVLATEKIRITFSEPMDVATVANSLAVAPLAKSALGLAWSADATVLTITPAAGLPYASGTAISTTTALTYTVTLDKSAKDLAGNALASAYSSSFTTMRRVTQTLAPELVGTWDTYAPAVGSESPNVCGAADRMELGWWQNAHNGGTYYGYVYFDLNAAGTVPQGAKIEQATLRAMQAVPSASFYPAGSVVLERLDHQAFDKTILQSVLTGLLGTLCTNDTSQPQLDISPSVMADFNAAQYKVLYRLSATGSSVDQYAWFLCGQFSLRVISVLP